MNEREGLIFFGGGEQNWGRGGGGGGGGRGGGGGGGGGGGEANQLEREVFEIFWMKGWCFPCTPIVGNPAFPDLHPFSGS